MQEVYAIPLPDQHLVYAPLHKVVLVLNTQAFQEFKEERSEYFAAGLVSELKHSHPEFPSSRSGPINPFFLGIISTRSCNMSCGYCGFGASSSPSKKMDLETAVSCVDWLVQTVRQQGGETLNIHFFGGEPLLAWDVIQTVVHRARWLASKYQLTTHFEVSTNGLLDEKKARFVGDYFDVVVLSMDGWKTLHDRTRPINEKKGSFDLVATNARLWKNSPLRLCLRMCVTQESVCHLEEVGKWFCDEFQPDVINFDTLQDWPKSLEAGIQKPDPYQFASHFLRARESIEKYGIEAIYAADYSPTLQHSFCPLGKDAVMVTPEGILNGCYLLEEDWIARGLDLRLGHIEPEKGFHFEENAVAKLRKLVEEKPDCDGCFCKWSCAGGCHVNHSYPGAELDPSFCIQTRIITVCTLLREAGERELAIELLRDPGTLKNLATQTSYQLN